MGQQSEGLMPSFGRRVARRRATSAVAATFASVMLGHSPTFAVERTWIGPQQSAAFSNPNYWSPSGAPGTNDAVLFNTASQAQPAATQAGVQRLTVRRGSVTLSIAGSLDTRFGGSSSASLVVSDAAGPDATLSLISGPLLAG